MEGYWSGERKTRPLGPDRPPAKDDCSRRFYAPDGYVGGAIDVSDRRYDVRGWFREKPDDPEDFERIGFQDVEAAACDPSLFDGDQYLVVKITPSPKNEKGALLAKIGMGLEGSVYPTETQFVQHFDDFDEAKAYAEEHSSSPGGKEVLGRGGSIEVHDRKGGVGGGVSISRHEEAPITPVTGMDPSNYSRMGSAGPKEYYEE